MTDEYISKIEEITGKDQRNRMLEIVRIMRRHDFVRNFMKQQNPEEVRFALEELGPTFIKGGQILSTRPDLISPAFISEFKKLQDDVQIDSFESVSKTFREQTEKNISDVFDKFDEKPFASASIGQTHHAVLKNGTQVVVKVQHPKIKELVETDLTLFRQALKILKLAPEITVVDPEEILNQLQESLLNEINTEIEIKNGLEFYRLNNHDGIIEVPVVYEEYSIPEWMAKASKNWPLVRFQTIRPSASFKKKSAHTSQTYWSKTSLNRFSSTISFMLILTRETSFSIA